MKEEWQGTFTAVVTPFNSDGTLDEKSLRKLVDFQVDGGVEGLVPCGTTGESVTMSLEEQKRVVEVVLEQVDGRVAVVAGAGGNATDKVVSAAREMESLGADAILSVVPYYNKPTQEGMFQHFSKVADAVTVPVVLYNVPGRTSSNMLPETVLRLAEHANVKAVKEASGNLIQVMEIVRGAPEGFRVLSGEDNLTFPILSLGGHGVISVISNEVPMMMSRMVRDALSGNWNDARDLHYKLLGLMNANFIETNPTPVKAALAMMGLIQEAYRLPLVPMKKENRERLREHLVKLELVEG
jgi:4-hydroxy-tetrahydrodipicolinate synthase